MTAAEPDTEDKLARLKMLAERIKSDEAERKELRDDLLKTMEGSVYFLDASGAKRRAFVVTPEPVVVDDKLIDELPNRLLDEIYPRALDKKGLERAVSSGRLSQDLLARYARIEKGSSHIRFDEA